MNRGLLENLKRTWVLCFALMAYSATAMANDPVPKERGTVAYASIPDHPVPASTVAAPSVAPHADQVLTSIKETLKAQQTAQQQQSAQDAKAYGTALRNAGSLGALMTQRGVTLDAQIAASAQERASSEKLKQLKDQRDIVSRYTRIFICRGSAPQAWQTSAQTQPNVVGGVIAADLLRPGFIVAIAGCNFGTNAGTATLNMTKTGQKFALAYTFMAPGYWSTDLLYLQVPTITGVPDQTANIVVTTATGAVSAPLQVDFVADRDAQFFDLAHGNIVSVNHACAHATTEDSCGGALPNDPHWPGGRNFIDVHYKFCCSSHNGTDVYSFKFANGWTFPDLDRYGIYPQSLFSNPPEVLGGLRGGILVEGYRRGQTCNVFGTNHPGVFKTAADSLSPLPGYAAQAVFTWHVDGHCSWVEFDGDFIVTGPIGTPYWQ